MQFWASKNDYEITFCLKTRVTPLDRFAPHSPTSGGGSSEGCSRGKRLCQHPLATPINQTGVDPLLFRLIPSVVYGLYIGTHIYTSNCSNETREIGTHLLVDGLFSFPLYFSVYIYIHLSISIYMCVCMYVYIQVVRTRVRAHDTNSRYSVTPCSFTSPTCTPMHPPGLPRTAVCYERASR